LLIVVAYLHQIHKFLSPVNMKFVKELIAVQVYNKGK